MFRLIFTVRYWRMSPLCRCFTEMGAGASAFFSFFFFFPVWIILCYEAVHDVYLTKLELKQNSALSFPSQGDSPQCIPPEGRNSSSAQQLTQARESILRCERCHNWGIIVLHAHVKSRSCVHSPRDHMLLLPLRVLKLGLSKSTHCLRIPPASASGDISAPSCFS